jgi:superfamily II DNA or RNA helicase
MWKLRNYQTTSISKIWLKIADGVRRLVYQLATGGGKTVVLCAIAAQYWEANRRKVVVYTHKEELLNQARGTFWNWYQITAQPVTQEVKRIEDVPVYVVMVETGNNRLKKDADFYGDVGLVIIDECHIGNFKKIQEHHPHAKIIGFTATPISASKKDPLNKYFEDIVCGIDIPDLIKLHEEDSTSGLVQNRTFHVKGSVDRSKLKVSGQDFNADDMAAKYKKPKAVENTVKGYRDLAHGTKAIVYNCNIEHSILVNQEFIAAGYNSRHIDSEMCRLDPDLRKETVRWFIETPGAILNNVGLFTTGTDISSIQTIVVNRSTMSLSLWLQMCGRGARPHEDKDHFTIIDLGGNAVTHGDWCDARNWEMIFHNPPAPCKTPGVAPVKDCEACMAIVPVQAPVCKFCGFVFPVKETAKERPVEFELLTKNIDVRELMDKHTDAKEFYVFFAIGYTLANYAKRSVPPELMDVEIAESILVDYHARAREWYKLRGKKWNGWAKARAQEHLYKLIVERFPHMDGQLTWEEDLNTYVKQSYQLP